MLQNCSSFKATVAILLVSTLAVITLDIKWTYQIPSQNSLGKKVLFSHPLLQVAIMFLGSMICLGIFYIKKCIQQLNARNSLNEKKNTCELTFKVP